MAGHRKWSKVKHIKGPLDVKRGAMFSRLVKGITPATRLGSGNPGGHMPKANIKRAVKKGSCELENGHLKTTTHEGYAPGVVALSVETATDNMNRTVVNTCGLFAIHQGALVPAGRASYMFHEKGPFAVARTAGVEKKHLLELALDAGTGDIITDQNHFSLLTPADRFYLVRETQQTGDIAPDSRRLTFVPDLMVTSTDALLATKVPRLHGMSESYPDTQNVCSNFDTAEDVVSCLHR